MAPMIIHHPTLSTLSRTTLHLRPPITSSSLKQHHHRPFTTTQPTPYKFKPARRPKTRRTHPHNLQVYKSASADPPPYPYEPTQKLYRQADTGLYGGMRVHYGNNVSAKNEIKTRRTWQPNVVRKKLHSLALGRTVQLKVATRVLRTMDKVGGLDEYLLGTSAARIKELGVEGWRWRWVVLQALKDTERVRGDPRLMLELRSGIPRSVVEEVEEDEGDGGSVVVAPEWGTTVQIPEENGVEEEDRRRREDEELEDTIRKRLQEDREMRDVKAPLTAAGRAKDIILAPFREIARFFGRR